MNIPHRNSSTASTANTMTAGSDVLSNQESPSTVFTLRQEIKNPISSMSHISNANPNTIMSQKISSPEVMKPVRYIRRKSVPGESTRRQNGMAINAKSYPIPEENSGAEREFETKFLLRSYFTLIKPKIWLKYIIESPYTVALMCGLTIWSLFSDDLRVLLVNKSGDSAIKAITSVTFFLFIIEILLTSSYNKSYFHSPQWSGWSSFSSIIHETIHMGSFYFLLDCLATFTLVLEIDWIVSVNVDSFPTMLSRVGLHVLEANAICRFVRVCRIIRLIRISKLYKYITVYYRDVEVGLPLLPIPTLGGVASPKSVASEEITRRNRRDQESHVGAAMSDLTNRRVIVLIFTLLVLIPLFIIYDEDTTPIIATQLIHNIAFLNNTDPSTYDATLTTILHRTIESTSVIGINLQEKWYYYNSQRISYLREENILHYETNENGFYTSLLFDYNYEASNAALFGIYITIFIAILLLLSTWSFTREVNRLVIIPIDRMVALVKKISANPLGVEYKVLGEKDGFLEGMETTILLTTITKIGGLMRVGFGEAGASIIARNLADSAGGKLNLMGAGNMIQSIFGFCDIRQFTDTTECLQEEVMLFVNRIAHILHGIVVQCAGTANKNIGDAFLLTWKIDGHHAQNESTLADQALLAFCKALVELSRHQHFICDFSVEATSRLYTRFPGYKVKIGFGLHRGWAIEGAIGSNRKIDASYLSPHVSFTEYLESSTKKYGVAMLLSEPFYKILSDDVKSFCREIDRVRRKEDIYGNTETIIGLYTYDVDSDINWENVDHRRKMHALRRHGMLRRASKKILSERHVGNRLRSTSDGAVSPDRRQRALPIAMDLDNSESGLIDSATKDAPIITIPSYDKRIWHIDEDLSEQRRHVDESFREKWENGFEAFIGGDWMTAKYWFEQTESISLNVRDSMDLRVISKSQIKDGPSIKLLRYMEEFGGVPPYGWAGFSYDC